MLYGVGKNLIPNFNDPGWFNDGSTLGGTMAVDPVNPHKASLILTASAQGKMFHIPVESGKTYTFSFKNITGLYRFYKSKVFVHDSNMVMVNHSVAGLPLTYTFTADDTFKGFVTIRLTQSIAGTFLFENMQLEEGSVATVFEPYKLGNKPVAQKGLSFDGTPGDYVYFGGIAKIPFGLADNYTIHARIKTGDIKNQYYGIFSTFEPQKGFELNIDGGNSFRLENNLPSGVSLRANAALRVMSNTVYDVVAIRKGKDVIFYINGVLAATNYLDPQTTEKTGIGSNTFRIGARSNQMPFLGEIHRIDLFNKVLTADEALNLSKDIDVTSGLVAKYDFRKPITKGIAKDLSGNGIDGGIVGTKPGMQIPSLVQKKNLIKPLTDTNMWTVTGAASIVDAYSFKLVANASYQGTPAMINVEPNTTYTFSFEWESDAYSVTPNIMSYTEALVYIGSIFNNSVTNKKWSVTFTTGATVKKVKILLQNSNNTGTFIFKNFQLELGSTVTPFEPYKGVNPKPELQPKKNLIPAMTSYDLTKAGSTYTVPTSFYFLSGFNASATDYVTPIGDYHFETVVSGNNRDVVVLIPAKPNTTYRPSCDTNADVHLMYYDSARAKITQTYNTISANVTGTTPANCAFIGFVLTNRGLGPGKYYFKNWQLEEVGSTSAPATPFEKYKPVNKPAVRYPKKNLVKPLSNEWVFNGNAGELTIVGDYELKIAPSGTFRYVRIAVPVEIGKTYRLRGDVIGNTSTSAIRVFKSNDLSSGNIVAKINSGETFTVDASYQGVINFILSNGDQIVPTTIKNFQLEEVKDINTPATSFEPYSLTANKKL